MMLQRIDISCARATLLIEKQLDNNVTLLQRLRLRLHYRRCPPCETYARQAGKLAQLLRQDPPADLPPEHLKQLQQDIKTLLGKKEKKEGQNL